MQQTPLDTGPLYAHYCMLLLPHIMQMRADTVCMAEVCLRRKQWIKLSICL